MTSMNLTVLVVLAALLGFLVREWYAIEHREEKDKPFSARYYIRKNKVILVGNLLGTLLLWLGLPEVLRIQSRLWDENFPVITSGLVGLLGAILVREAQGLLRTILKKYFGHGQ